MTKIVATLDRHILCHDKKLAEVLDASFFGFPIMGQQKEQSPYSSMIPVSSGGRNAAWFVEHSLFSGVLRKYRRGGLIGKLVHRVYFWEGEARTRSWSEFVIMDNLYSQGFPVPRPLGAFYRRSGFTYQAALLTEKIPQARTLVEVIKVLDKSEYEKYAEKVARTIKDLHLLNVNHADLNGFNILFDKNDKVYLIDFDKSHYQEVQGEWCFKNLDRLERHLKKVLGQTGFVFMTHIRKKYS